MLTRVLLGWKSEEVKAFEALKKIESEPSPLLEAIRAYLDRAQG